MTSKRNLTVASMLALTGAFAVAAGTPAMATSSQEYLSAFSSLPGLDPDETAVSNAAGSGDATALAAVDGNETQATTADNSVAAARQQAGQIIGPQGSRTAAIRSGVNFAFNGQPMSREDLLANQNGFAGTGGGAQAGSSGLGGRLGGFLNVKYGSGEQEGNANEAGFDFDVIGVLGGVDYRFSDKFVAGIAFGFDRTDGEFNAPATGDLDTNSFSFSAYATYYPTDAIYVDALLSYARNDIDSERDIISGTVNRTAKGDTDGNRISGSASVGYQFTHQALTYGPYGQANYVYANVDGFTESGAGNFNLVVDDEDVRSFTSVFGVRADYAISTSFGVISPSIRAEWEHEFSNDSRTVVTAFSANPSGLINVQTQAPDRNYFNVGVGVAATLAGGISAFADFEILLAHKDLDNHTITVGARMEF